jgi:hypothetical protein
MRLGLSADAPVSGLDQKYTASQLAKFDSKRNASDTTANNADIEHDHRKIWAVLRQID